MQRKMYAGDIAHLRARSDAFRLFFAERSPASATDLKRAARAQTAVARATLRQASDAYDRRAVENLSALEYQALAVHIDPAVRGGRAWSALQARRAGVNPLRRVVRSAARSLEGRLRWRIWHRWGL
jgi:hypothetical protein